MIRIDPQQFVATVRPLLACGDADALRELLHHRWTEPQISGLLTGADADTKKVVAVALSLIGGHDSVCKIAPLLRTRDPMLAEFAEHAMWSIWFRLGSTEANRELGLGAIAMHQRLFDRAIKHFNEAIELSPRFAEAYNQRAIAHYVTEHYDRSLDDCRRAVALMPCHFGALAGMGHCYCDLGNLPAAIRRYRKALAVNPHLKDIREGLASLQARVDAGE